MLDTLSKVLSFLDQRAKKKAFLIMILLGISGVLEALGIGLLIPFITLASDPKIVQRQAQLQRLYNLLGRPDDRLFLIQIGTALIAVFVFKNAYSVAVSYVQGRFLLDQQTALEGALYSSYLHQPYPFFIRRNLSELRNNCRNSVHIMYNVAGSMLTVASDAFMFLCIVAMLVYFKPLTSLMAIVILGSLTAVLYRFTRKELRRTGELMHQHDALYDQWANQGFGGIKEIKVLGKEDFFSQQTMKHGYDYSYYRMKGVILSQLPKPFIETAGFTGIILFVFAFLFSGHGAEYVVPTLVLFAGATVRLMPALNRIVSSILIVRQSGPIVEAMHRDLNEARKVLAVDSLAKRTNSAGIHLEKSIDFRNVSYQYAGANLQSLREVSFSIPRGRSVALVGPSGAGKTTVVDVLLGLLPEFQGEVLVDGKSIRQDLRGWQDQIGYIPQSIYLSDDTFRRNIAFGLNDEEIDEARVLEAVRLAHLDDVISSLPNGLDTRVGERGVRISGGQRQRVGIARALYLNPEVLVLDEATSALDNETEKEVTLAIDRLSGQKTIVVIAHRLSTVTHCDQLFFMRDGKIVASGSYSQLLAGNSDFQKFAHP